MAVSQNLAIPLKLDAFVFNSAICEGGDEAAKIAPITQPNYTFLRLTQHLAQNDILDRIDIHNAWPAKSNPRLTDLSRGNVRQNRLGVYLHWLMPRPFRSGAAKSENKKPTSGSNDDYDNDKDATSPTFYQLPNRWLVIRKLDPNVSTTVPQGANIKPVQAWVIESDKMYSIDELGPEVDLQVDKSPFITSFLPTSKKPEDISILKQAEVFIGECTPADQWNEPVNEQDQRPRVELTATSSSNQLFLDFQYHNSNVLSMLDNFQYQDGGETKYLEAAHASYYVVGWQQNEARDVLYSGASTSLSTKSRGARLASLGMFIDKTIPNSKDIEAWLNAPNSARSVCHGAMYDVEWTAKDLPTTRPADNFAKVMKKRPPIAVGTTPIDSIMSYITSRTPSNETETSIKKLETLLRAADDSIDSHVAAEDEVQNYNYAHSDGGSFFYLSGPDAKDDNNVGNPPEKQKQDEMRKVNAAQRLFDGAGRRIKQIKWELFSCWWRSISDIDEAGNSIFYVLKENYKNTINDLTKELRRLDTFTKSLQSRAIGTPEALTKKGVVEDFHQRNDPTLMLAGLCPGWPRDFSDKVKTRLDAQIVKNDSVGDLPAEYGVSKLPGALKDSVALKDTAALLVKEFLKLASQDDGEAPPPTDAVPPLFHDGCYVGNPSKDNPWRDRWTATQPWFPIYLEWETEYIHVPFEDWTLKTRDCGKTQKLAHTITYTLNKDVEGKNNDNRIASGRSLILPQPSFNLKLYIDRLIDTIPAPDLEKVIPETERKTLQSNLDRLSFLSTPLAGLTDHLLTRYQGNHIKPLVREPGKKPVVMEEVANLASNIGISRDKLAEIDTESDPTPYSSLPSLVGRNICAFKPVTHGQMRFTKLNVIDKFGQVVHALDPKDEQPKPLYPDVGDFYAVDPLPKDPPSKPDGCTDTPNVVDRSRSKTLSNCEFVQLPPSINQPTRLNAYFVKHGDSTQGEADWRPVTEWENPVWGWIVINYVDNGIQTFQPNGKFYREVRVTAGEASEVKWLPFEPPKDIQPNAQLDFLIEMMNSPEGKGQAYLRTFMNMASAALANVTPTPSAYGQFMNSLVGRPLALVNMGWSLELGSAPRSNESTVDDQSPDNAPQQRYLTEDPSGNDRPTYEFPLKLGDKSRNYDGMVGYFEPPAGKPSGKPGDDLDLGHIYTYYGFSDDSKDKPVDPADLLQPIDRLGYPILKPFWLDPKMYVPDDTTDEEALKAAAQAYERDRDSRLLIFGALIDPFSPITGFSSILPVRTLALPPWTWQSALKTMTTFFHAGPLLLSEDTAAKVPPYDENEALDEKYNLAEREPAGKIELPGLQAADWNWLMPYEGEKFMPLGILKGEKEMTREAKGPMLAVEGYLQLRQPVERDKPLEKPVNPSKVR